MFLTKCSIIYLTLNVKPANTMISNHLLSLYAYDVILPAMILEKPVGACPIRRRETRHGFWPLKDEEKG